MRIEHEYPMQDSDAVALSHLRRRRRAQAGAWRPQLTLVSIVAPPPGDRDEGTGGAGRRQPPASSGELVVRRERRGDAVVLRLTGKLDQATSALLERELDAEAIPPTPLLLDAAGLEFIDAHGLDTLARAQRRARENGGELAIEGAQDTAHNEIYYFALAMACADVDHQRPLGDRSRGTPDRSPTRQQARAAPPLLLSAARAAPPVVISLPIPADDNLPPAA
jgi:anti-anti-sigma factor